MAFEQLHDDETLPIPLADVVDRADIRVVQRRSHLSLPPETGESLRVARKLIGQKLQGYEALQPCVSGLVHNAHSDRAQAGETFIVTDPGAAFQSFGAFPFHRRPLQKRTIT